MLELVQAILLGVVQGLTEFLPVSSSGHLLLGQYFLGMDQDRFGLTFDASIHTGTVLAVVSFFWRDLLRMAAAFGGSLRGSSFAVRDQRMACLILVACIPAGVVGYLAIRFLLNYLTRHSLRVFAYYRFALAAVVVVLLLFGIGGF